MCFGFVHTLVVRLSPSLSSVADQDRYSSHEFWDNFLLFVEPVLNRLSKDPRRKETLSPNFYIEELHRANSPFMVLRPVNKLEHYIDAQSTILLSLTEVPVARIQQLTLTSAHPLLSASLLLLQVARSQAGSLLVIVN